MVICIQGITGEAQSLEITTPVWPAGGCGVRSAGTAYTTSETGGNLTGEESMPPKGGAGRGLAEGSKVLDCFIPSRNIH